MAYNYNINGNGQSIEQYNYDEFGIPCFYKDNEVIGLLTRSIQPFGFNGYEMDEVGGLYFAQARRYDAGVGRFVSEDFIKGHIAVPYTMNHYNYCWNRPMDLVDLNGMWPSLKDIGEGIKSAANSVGEFVSDHKQQITVGLIIGGSVLAAGAILGAGADAGTLANGIWNGFSNLLGFSIGDISYIQTGVIYDGMQNLLNYEKDISKNVEKSKE